MIDELTAKADLDGPVSGWGDKKIMLGNLDLFAENDKSTGDLKYYVREINKFRITVTETYVKLSNSLAVLLRGSNAVDLSLNEFRYVLEKLMKIINMKSENFRLTRVACGFNVPISEDPSNFYNLLKGLLLKEPAPMLHRGRKYGIKFIQSDGSIKAYDKRFEQSVHYGIFKPEGYLLRLEIEMKRKQLPGFVKTLADVATREGWLVLYNQFVKRFNNIKKSQMINFQGKKPKELQKIFAEENPGYWRQLRANSPNTFKKYRAVYRRTQRQATHPLYSHIMHWIEERFSVLLSNENEHDSQLVI